MSQHIQYHNSNRFASGGSTPIMDTLTHTPRCCVSFRQLYAAATKCIQLEKISDGSLLDIGFDSNGYINESEISSHLGGGSGRIAKWYDQSTAAYDLSQGTAGDRPLLSTNATNSLRAAEFDNATGQYIQNNTGTVAQPFQYFFVGEEVAGPTGVAVIAEKGTAGSNRCRFWRSLSTINGNMYIHANTTSVFSADGYKNFPLSQFTALFDDANSYIRDSGTSIASGTAIGSGSTDGLTLGGTSVGTAVFDGYFHEFIFVDEMSTADRDTLETNQQTYWSV